jgi:hypothetical protein
MIPLSEWLNKEAEHLACIKPYTESFRERRNRRHTHPVYDFLFTYYAHPPGRLELWHPGHNIELEALNNYGDQSTSKQSIERFINDDRYNIEQGIIKLRTSILNNKLRSKLSWVIDLLETLNRRTARFGCYALHEWSMLYKIPENERRHTTWSLRVSPTTIQEVVESNEIRCTHFDAFRFFTPPAKKRNLFNLTSQHRLDNEQGGCIHATMDLYKWAFSFSPGVSSDIVRDCFLLAVKARELDMRSSPYELTSLGFEPIRVETKAGRLEFIEQQQTLALEASKIRNHLLSSLLSLRNFVNGDDQAK